MKSAFVGNKSLFFHLVLGNFEIQIIFFQIIASLIAFVAAEAESDPAHLYAIHHGGTHMTNGFVQYSNGAVVPQDTASVMAAKGAHLNAKAMVHPYHILKAVVPTVKATPEMTETKKVVTYATPSYPFYSGYPHVAPYTAYPYTTPLTTGVAPIYTTPLTHVQVNLLRINKTNL